MSESKPQPKSFVPVLVELDVRIDRYLSDQVRAEVSAAIAKCLEGLDIAVVAGGVPMSGEVIESREVFIGDDERPRSAYPQSF